MLSAMNILPMVGADQLAKLRDGIIAAGSISYLSGFLVVASYSAWKGFGLTKVLDSQYIVAGLLPALVVFVTVQLLRASKRTADGMRVAILESYTKRKLQDDGRGADGLSRWTKAFGLLGIVGNNLIKSWLYRISFGVFFISIIVANAEHLVDNATIRNIFFGVGLFAFIALSVASVAIGVALINLVNDLHGEPPRTLAVARTAWKIYLVPLPLLLGGSLFTMAYLYVTAIFPLMPIEFGGAAPRCVLLAAKTGFLGDAKDQPLTLHKLTLELPSDPYVFSDADKHIWQIARDQVLAMRSCEPG